MRWNCPHCGVNLAIADEKMTTSWSFSRCYQCGGFALIRRSEINIIKVDRAPAGEKVLLPESSEQPMLSHEASKNLARYSAPTTANANEKSVVKPATRRTTSSGFSNPLRPSLATQEIPSAPPRHVLAEETQNIPVFDELPPEVRDAISTLPQQQAVVGPKAPAGASADRKALQQQNYMNGINGRFPEPLPEVPLQTGRAKLLPFAIGIAGAIAVGSGIYLFVQGQALLSKTRAAAPVQVDRPIRNVSYSRPVHETEAESPQAPAPIQKQPEAAPKKESPTSASSYSDRLRSQAMAPDRQPSAERPAIAPPPVQLSQDNPPLLVQPKAKNIHLRAGPGMVYPVVGRANENAKYVVTDWNDRWFKVLPQIPAHQGELPDESAGWIRTDAVQVIPAAATASN